MTKDDVIAAIQAAGLAGDYNLALTLTLTHGHVSLRACLVCGATGAFRYAWQLHQGKELQLVRWQQGFKSERVFSTCLVGKLHDCSHRVLAYLNAGGFVRTQVVLSDSSTDFRASDD